jgi:hypothetical protein
VNVIAAMGGSNAARSKGCDHNEPVSGIVQGLTVRWPCLLPRVSDFKRKYADFLLVLIEVEPVPSTGRPRAAILSASILPHSSRTESLGPSYLGRERRKRMRQVSSIGTEKIDLQGDHKAKPAARVSAIRRLLCLGLPALGACRSAARGAKRGTARRKTLANP